MNISHLNISDTQNFPNVTCTFVHKWKILIYRNLKIFLNSYFLKCKDWFLSKEPIKIIDCSKINEKNLKVIKFCAAEQYVYKEYWKNIFHIKFWQSTLEKLTLLNCNFQDLEQLMIKITRYKLLILQLRFLFYHLINTLYNCDYRKHELIKHSTFFKKIKAIASKSKEKIVPWK